jgi:hypothetical protein
VVERIANARERTAGALEAGRADEDVRDRASAAAPPLA